MMELSDQTAQQLDLALCFIVFVVVVVVWERGVMLNGGLDVMIVVHEGRQASRSQPPSHRENRSAAVHVLKETETRLVHRRDAVLNSAREWRERQVTESARKRWGEGIRGRLVCVWREDGDESGMSLSPVSLFFHLSLSSPSVHSVV